ncbi:hypothetical protein [Rhodococcus sp. 06-1460-1B]|uniref:hypothetical protein n=1 Tax=Rhodococcus sp. 06-1460-1B TaxID=2022501 RepID=UPI0011407A22|nr:hypothetical protein [Rhodococcus sp. 06-1460-1B]
MDTYTRISLIVLVLASAVAIFYLMHRAGLSVFQSRTDRKLTNGRCAHCGRILREDVEPFPERTCSEECSHEAWLDRIG